MRKFIREFVKTCVAPLPHLSGPILEVGSLQVSKPRSMSNLRTLFPGYEYVGLDMRDGPGVDRVGDITHHEPDLKAGTVICLDTLEHVSDPFLAVANMAYSLVGPLTESTLVLVTVFDHPIHEHPHDLWRFTTQGLEMLLMQPRCQHIFEKCVYIDVGPAIRPHTVMAIGFTEKVDTSAFGYNVQQWAKGVKAKDNNYRYRETVKEEV